MKKELIKTDNYLLVVDDSEIKKGDYFYVTTKNIYGGNIISQSTGNGEFAWSEHILSKDTDEKGYHPSHCKKATAHLPLNDSPILEGVPLLPPLEVDDDVEKLNEDLFDKGSDNVLHPQYQMRTFFNMGYNKAKEKYKFTEDDIQKAFTHCAKYAAECISSGVKVDFLGRLEMYLEFLSQPKTPTHFEFEMVDFEVDMGLGEECIEYGQYPKTTTNSQGQQVVCGKYIY